MGFSFYPVANVCWQNVEGELVETLVYAEDEDAAATAVAKVFEDFAMIRGVDITTVLILHEEGDAI